MRAMILPTTFLSLLACQGPPEPQWPEQGLLLLNLNTLDALGPQQGVSLLLSQGYIHGVYPNKTAFPDRYERLDAQGLTAIPGLIDAHVHLAHSGAAAYVGDTLDDNVRASLSWGVLGAQDAGGPLWIRALRDEIAAGRMLGPRLRVTGPFLTATLSHPCETRYDPSLCLFVDGDGEAQAQALRDSGSDLVKVALQDADFTPWPNPRLDLADLADICQSGEALVHIGEEQDAADTFAAGCRRLAHPPFGDAVSAETAALPWLELHSTVSAFGSLDALLRGQDVEDFVATPEAVRETWAEVQDHPELLLSGFAEENARWLATLRANLTLLAQAQAPLFAGSDAGYTYVPHGQALHAELRALVEAGLDPVQALEAATWTPAQAWGWEDSGLLRAGLRADLVLLSCDPAQDIACTEAIERVVLGGELFTPEALRAVELRQEPLQALCLDDADCPGACDRVEHRCVQACEAPYTDLSSCPERSWCAPADGLSSPEGACHEDLACDWRAQDCGPEAYPQTCAPRDWDSSACWPAGDLEQGQTCDWDRALCAPGLYCSPVSEVCLTLCDPEAGAECPDGTLCHTINGEDAEIWFGLCW